MSQQSASHPLILVEVLLVGVMRLTRVLGTSSSSQYFGRAGVFAFRMVLEQRRSIAYTLQILGPTLILQQLPSPFILSSTQNLQLIWEQIFQKLRKRSKRWQILLHSVHLKMNQAREGMGQNNSFEGWAVIKLLIMRKHSGIIRNKTNFFVEARQRRDKKKNRFQNLAKMDASFEDSTPSMSEQMMTSTSIHSTEESAWKEVYQKAKAKLEEVSHIQKKMSAQAKARLSSFKEKENQRYDQSISKLASEATKCLVIAEKILMQMNKAEVKNESDRKLIQNMSQSLACEIREVSRNLRLQEKQYFDTIRSYEKNTKNVAIELSEEQKHVMMGMQEEMEDQTNDLQNNKVDELVKNINKLSAIYKELNNLVIEQGSLIDRIDVNIESTLTHTQKAVVHLVAADEAASSPFADRLMKVLAVMILVLAIILGLKWSA